MVIAIIGIMLAVSLPSFIGLSRGANMRSAVIQLRSTLSLARQWAITRRVPTYVVFPAYYNNMYSGFESHVTKAYRAYSVYTATNGYVQEWRYLPQGIVFVVDSTSVGNPNISNANSLFSSSDTEQKEWDLPFPSATDSEATVRAIQFSPDGSSMMREDGKQKGLDLEIFLAEGWTTVNTDDGTMNPTTPEYKATLEVQGIQVYKLTGQVRVREYTK